jgi:hypothetical protein
MFYLLNCDNIDSELLQVDRKLVEKCLSCPTHSWIDQVLKNKIVCSYPACSYPACSYPACSYPACSYPACSYPAPSGKLRLLLGGLTPWMAQYLVFVDRSEEQAEVQKYIKTQKHCLIKNNSKKIDS